jgi:hypothetical protein
MWQGAKAKCIRRWIPYQLMKPVIAEVADAHGRAGTEGLFHLQTPLLILRRFEQAIVAKKGWRREAVNLGLDFREAFSRCESAQELRVLI